MRFNHLMNVLARRRSGAWVLGGIAAVLQGVERLLGAPRRPRPDVKQHILAPIRAAKSARKDFFSIKRTQSDLGFTYWVLQGHGLFASFELFDTWGEAIAAAEKRLADARAEVLPVAG